MFPNFIALIPCRFSRKIRVKTIPSNRTIVSAPRYFGIGIPRVRAVTTRLASTHRRVPAAAKSTPLPAIYSVQAYPEVGGLISYGTDVLDAFRQVGVYT